MQFGERRIVHAGTQIFGTRFLGVCAVDEPIEPADLEYRRNRPCAGIVVAAVLLGVEFETGRIARDVGHRFQRRIGNRGVANPGRVAEISVHRAENVGLVIGRIDIDLAFGGGVGRMMAAGAERHGEDRENKRETGGGKTSGGKIS